MRCELPVKGSAFDIAGHASVQAKAKNGDPAVMRQDDDRERVPEEVEAGPNALVRGKRLIQPPDFQSHRFTARNSQNWLETFGSEFRNKPPRPADPVSARLFGQSEVLRCEPDGSTITRESTVQTWWTMTLPVVATPIAVAYNLWISLSMTILIVNFC